MIIKVFSEKLTSGKAAAAQAAETILRAIRNSGKARTVTAGAASQFEFLDALTSTQGLDWNRVELFHLDE